MRICALSFAAAVGLCSATAGAATSAQLVYTRAPEAASCPDQMALRSAVASRIGYDPFVAMARTTVVAEIARTPDAFVGHVLLVDDAGVTRGRRDLSSTAASCEPTFEAVALAISIALDAEAADAPISPPPPAPAPSRPATEPPAPEPPPPRLMVAPREGASTTTVSPSGVTWSTAAAALLAFGIAPAASTGAMVSLDGRLGRLAFGVDGRGLLRSSGERTAISLLGGGASLCAVLDPARVCAVGVIGSLEASGTAIAAPRSDTALFAAFGARAAVDIPASRWLAVRMGAEGLFNAHRATLTVDGLDAWTAPTFAVTGFAGLSVQIP